MSEGMSSPRSPISVKELYEDLSAELWQVQTESGYVKLMSIDEIDTAYKAEALGRDTLLRRAGTTTWRTLGDILGPEDLPASAEADSLMPFAVGPGDDIRPQALPTMRELPWFPVVSDPPQAPLTAAELATVRPRTARKLASPALLLMAAFAGMFVLTSVAVKTMVAPPPAAANAPPEAVSSRPEAPPAEPTVAPMDSYIESSAVLVLVQSGKKAKAKPRAAAKVPALPSNPFDAPKPTKH
jgi:hypothetical protein